MHRYHLRRFELLIRTSAAALLLPGLAAAQTSGLLRLQQIQVSHAGPQQFQFYDYGTGATNYLVEFSPSLGTNPWLVDSNAVITAQGNGSYTVRLNEPLGTNGFYRVSGLGGSNPGEVATFTTTAFQVVEGSTVDTMLVLSRPYQGWIYYTVSGTAATGDYQSLSGSNYVRGTTAVLPVSLIDNNVIGQLKYLTLTLEAGPGYSVGLAPSTTITILENDAAWRGGFTAENATLGFTLVLTELNGVYQATLKGNGSDFFPTNEIPASISLTPTSFSAAATSIPLPASATLFNTPATLALYLNAMNGLTNQTVSPTQIQGTGELIAQYSGQPQLNTTNEGTFLLLKSPIAPSTNEVQLVGAP
jgi:hypothetical protein